MGSPLTVVVWRAHNRTPPLEKIAQRSSIASALGKFLLLARVRTNSPNLSGSPVEKKLQQQTIDQTINTIHVHYLRACATPGIARSRGENNIRWTFSRVTVDAPPRGDTWCERGRELSRNLRIILRVVRETGGDWGRLGETGGDRGRLGAFGRI